jgi:phosphate acetyltransferase
MKPFERDMHETGNRLQPDGMSMDLIENRTIDEIAIGDRAEIERVLTQPDVSLFATVSVDVNPQNLDAGDEEGPELRQGIAHGMWAGTLISAVLATQLPGPGTVHLGQALKFHQPVNVGDCITVRVEVAEIDKATARVKLKCLCTNTEGETVVSGHAEVQAPRTKIKRHLARMPSSQLKAPGIRFGALVEQARALEPLRTAIVHPCDNLSLGGAIAARDEGMIVPLLVGPRGKIEAAADQAGLDLRGLEIVDAPHSHAAAEMAVALVHEGRAGALMKGKLHTDELLRAEPYLVCHRCGDQYLPGPRSAS